MKRHPRGNRQLRGRRLLRSAPEDCALSVSELDAYGGVDITSYSAITAGRGNDGDQPRRRYLGDIAAAAPIFLALDSGADQQSGRGTLTIEAEEGGNGRDLRGGRLGRGLQQRRELHRRG